MENTIALEKAVLPSANEVTVAEIDGALLNLSNSKDPKEDLYAKSEALYPILRIPFDIPINENREAQKPTKTLPNFKIFRKSPQTKMIDYYYQWKYEFENYIEESKKRIAFSLPPFFGNLFYDIPTESYITLLREKINSSPARLLAWHSYNSLFAVAHRLDAIFVYDLRVDSWFPEALETDLQMEITCMAWKPLGGNMLAVGCCRGICLWEMPLRANTTTGSVDGSIVLWDTAFQTGQVLTTTCRSCLLSWSPDGKYLLSGTLKGYLIIWETRSWTSKIVIEEREEILKSACWTANSKYVFLAFNDSAFIATLAITSEFHMKFLPRQYTSYPDDEIGGIIESLAIDSIGERLAVCFEETKLVAVYNVNQALNVPTDSSSGILSNVKFIRGPVWNELKDQGQIVAPSPPKPVAISFANEYVRGGLLSVIWEDGKISMIPFIYHSKSSQ
ncbi:12070_t:CDS:10 [Ambispora leptoticha]|uniref:12070_t:CDS:1 n=1 Tax=Ambispora leptoticha TaxID=144679 RepID=A0A9N8W3Y8_9GLOM|nr:12070_t:CDS:10 [Ambispora leptoticha]